MTLLDTNVVSEAMKPNPNAIVRDWLDTRPAEMLYLSSVTIAELLFGIGVLPLSRRKDKLTEVLAGLMKMFEGRILPFDVGAARCYADLAVGPARLAKVFQHPMAVSRRSPSQRNIPLRPETRAPSNAAGLVVINPWVAKC